MSHRDEWSQMLEQTKESVDMDEREARIARISSDPKPKYQEPVQKPYPMAELHNIICFDEENGNISMPEASEQYGQPHKIGGVLASDRKHVPLGWIRIPPKGTSVETIKNEYPDLYEHLKEIKKLETF